MDMTLDPNKKVRMPRTRICYICGRQYGLSSFDIHLKQCKKLWIDRESKKPKHERKPLPRDPMESSGVDAVAVGGGGGGLGSTSGGSGGGNGGMTDAELQQLNDMAQDSYNNAALSKCAYCGRTFLPEKLLIHNKSCTAEKPAKRVGQARLSEDTAPMRPSDSGSFRPSSTTPTPSRHKTPNKQTLPWKSKKMAQTTGGMKRPPASTESNSSRAMTDETDLEEYSSPLNGSTEGEKTLAGNYGGAGSRALRKNSNAEMNAGITATLENLDARLSTVEKNVSTIMQDMGDLKVLLQSIHAEVSQK